MVTISQFVVIEGSPLIGLRLEEIIHNYNVKILHFHNPSIDYQTRMPYNPNSKIEKYFSIKVIGDEDNIRRLMLDSVKFK